MKEKELKFKKTSGFQLFKEKNYKNFKGLKRAEQMKNLCKAWADLESKQKDEYNAKADRMSDQAMTSILGYTIPDSDSETEDTKNKKSTKENSILV